MKITKKGSVTAGVVLWALAVCVVAFIGLMAVFRPAPPEVGEAVEKPAPVATEILVARDVPDVLSLPGRVEADADVVLSAEKGGRIQLLPVNKGDRVSAGQLLMQLDDRAWVALSKRAEIEWADATREEARWLRLKTSGAVSESDYDAIRNRLSLAEAALEEARVHVDQCRVVSPVDGVVNERYVEAGEYVMEGQRVFRVVNTDRVKVVVNVPEREVVHVRAGMPIAFESSSLEGLAGSGTVSFVSTAAPSGRGSFVVEVLVEQPDVRLLPGMLVNLAIARREWRDALVVPVNAVVPKKGHHVVFVVEQERAVARVVNIERFLGDSVVISSGLRAGDEIVVEGQRTLQDGEQVLVTRRP